MLETTMDPEQRWPALPLAEWWPTCTTLNRWAQIVGKTRLALAPFQNHWWHCTLYVSARGLSTSPMPSGAENVEVEFDFLSDELFLRMSDGRTQTVPLKAQSVAEFYRAYCAALAALGVVVPLYPRPSELPDTTPFATDETHAAYDGDAVRRWWRILSGSIECSRNFVGGSWVSAVRRTCGGARSTSRAHDSPGGRRRYIRAESPTARTT